MKKEKSSAMGTPYTFEGRIPLKQAIPLGLQHVMAMFIGNLTPLLIIMGACGLTADAGYGALRTALLQNAMTVAGIVTLYRCFRLDRSAVKCRLLWVHLLDSSAYSRA